MSGLDFAAVVDDFTSRVDESLGEVESGMIDLGEAQGYVADKSVLHMNVGQGDLHLVIPSRAANASEFFRVDWQRVFTILLEHRKRLLVVDLPDPVGVTWDPDFRKSDELASSLTSLVDEGDGLLDTSLEIEPAGLGSDGGGLILCEGHTESLYD